MPTERSLIGLNSEVGGEDKDQNHRHRLKDDVTLERSLKSKRDIKDVSDISGSKTNGGETTNNSDPTAVPRSQSFFQHDDRRTATGDGRHSGRRLISESRWGKDSKGEEREPHKGAPASDAKEGEGKSQALDHKWRHDRFTDPISDTHPPTKKRRPFREEKLPPPEPETLENKTIPEPNKASQLSSSIVRSERWKERGRDRPPLERNEHDRAYVSGRSFSTRGRVENVGFSRRDKRFNGVENDGEFRGRGNYAREQGSWSKGRGAEKWKHDLFDEANRSPSPKKEEDPVAKVEALLSM